MFMYKYVYTVFVFCDDTVQFMHTYVYTYVVNFICVYVRTYVPTYVHTNVCRFYVLYRYLIPYLQCLAHPYMYIHAHISTSADCMSDGGPNYGCMYCPRTYMLGNYYVSISYRGTCSVKSLYPLFIGGRVLLSHCIPCS